MKTQFRRLNAFSRFIGLDNIHSSSSSESQVSLTCRFSFDLILKLEQHKFKPDPGTDYLLYRRDPYWVFFHKFILPIP